MTRPVYLDGIPQNLEAAAMDALDWLRWWQWYLTEVVKQPEWAIHRRKLRAAVETLEHYLPTDEPEFQETPRPTPFVVVSSLEYAPEEE